MLEQTSSTTQSSAPAWISTESERLAALAEYEVLDTESERAFDELTYIAAQVCEVPVALVSLVDTDRQWFKARVGFEACQTPLDQSVCKLGMASKDLLIVPDLTLDPRTRDNALVTGGPRIRFYAGAPLVTPAGTIIGMLCAIDSTPRPEGLTAAQQRMMRGLADQVISRLELRKSLISSEREREREHAENVLLKRAAEQLRVATEVGEVGAFELDLATGAIEVTSAFRAIYGLADDVEVTGTLLAGLREGETRISFAAIDADVPTETVLDEYCIKRPSDGARRWIERRAKVALDANGKPAKFTGLVIDATDKRTVTVEIAHRLKNTLAIVQAITRHTLRDVADVEPVQALNRRLGALGTAHEILLSRGSGEACMHDVAQSVLAALGIEDRLTIAGKDAAMGPRAVMQLSMLLHELGTNAMKYGALSNDSGTVAIETAREHGDDGEPVVSLTWEESGGPRVEPLGRSGLGMRLLQSGLHPAGEVEIDPRPEGLYVRMSASAEALSN